MPKDTATSWGNRVRSAWREEEEAAKRREQLRREDLAVTKKIFKQLGKLHDEGLKKELQDLLSRPLLAQSIYLVDPFDAFPVGRAIRARERKASAAGS